MSAYKLREESIESDRFFRDCIEVGPIEEEQEIKVKQEIDDDNFADPFPVVYNTIQQPQKKKRKQQARTSNSPRQSRLDSEADDFSFKVDCHKKGINKSPAWDFFGRLVDNNGEVIEEEIGFYYCRLCVAEKKSIKNRYKGDSISTGMIFQHLKSAHGILKDSSCSDDTRSPALKATPPSIQGLTFSCQEDGCKKAFKLKICLDIHQGLEHTTAEEESTQCEYHVDTSQSKDLKSMAWSYYGALLNSNFEVVDDQHNYCRLCVKDGNLTKYLKSCSTTTLLHHIRDQHVMIKKKRKRFGDFDLSSISSTRLKKEEII